MAEKDFVVRLSDELAEQVSADGSRLKLAVPDYIAYLVQRHYLRTESHVSSYAVKATKRPTRVTSSMPAADHGQSLGGR